MNNPIDPNSSGVNGKRDPADSRADRTPAADMQDEDAGSANSGTESARSGANSASNSNSGTNANSASNADPSDRRAAESAMKQTSKTNSERGST